MPTTTKKDLIDRIADQTQQKRTAVKVTVQSFLENVIRELSEGNRLEFRDFGVFEIRERAPRIAQNPKTLERVPVPAKKTVKFKVGRLMKLALEGQLDADDQKATWHGRGRPIASSAYVDCTRGLRTWTVQRGRHARTTNRISRMPTSCGLPSN